jgi:Hexokinase
MFQVVIDIEWGAFGDNGVLDFIKTEFDKEVDKNSLLVGSFTLVLHQMILRKSLSSSIFISVLRNISLENIWAKLFAAFS